MELTIKIDNKKMYDSFVQFFQSLGVKIVSFTTTETTVKKKSGRNALRPKTKKNDVTYDISLLSEKALEEDWNSKDDTRWDKVL